MTKLSNNRNSVANIDWILIASGWLATQIVLYAIYGINMREEALTHISFAENLVNGTVPFELHRIWYSGYTVLLMLVRRLRLPYESVYILQLGLSFISVIYFIKIVSLRASTRTAIVLSGLMYATCFIAHQWTNHLFTDAVFFYLLVIAIYYLLNEGESKRNKIIFWLLLLLLPFFRPVGFLFIVVACAHWIFTSPKANRIKILTASIYLAIMFIMAYQSIVINSGYFYPFNNLNAEIICGRSSDLLQYQVVPYTENTSIIEYFRNNPELALRLFCSRLYKSFSMTRSYFSSGHNLAIGAVCAVYYTLAAAGMVNMVAKKIKTRYFLPVGCLVFCVPSVIFCVEWHGRMSIPMMAFMLLIAAEGIDTLLKLYNARK